MISREIGKAKFTHLHTLLTNCQLMEGIFDSLCFCLVRILTAVAAMAIPSVPSASIVTLVIILTSLNIPANDIALLFAVEWFL